MLTAAILALIAVAIAFWFINGRLRMGGNLRTASNVVSGLIVVGVVLWLINTYIPMANSIKVILNIVVVIATCVGVLRAFELWSEIVSFWRRLIHGRRFNPSGREGVREPFESHQH